MRDAVDVAALADIPAEPWRNGGGITRTLAVGDGWRASLAEIGRDGPYSRFAGTLRLSLIVAGAGVRLRATAAEHATAHELLPGQAVQYDGDAAWQASLIDGPALALNLIARAGAYRLHAQTLDAERGVPIGAHAGLVVLSGPQPCAVWEADGSRRQWQLAPFTVLRIPRLTASIQLCGAAAVAAPAADAGTRAPIQGAPPHWPIVASAEPLT
ncbi:HutD/Ves family protein [Chitinasiproducens palmae]|uniref:Various environmental stresses-induced protein Ves n=1 Tax=Chitinasiproducens palmae TaxID=1770053 RepID=A0A1H2PW01_9BURK|nr:HutD family protein [Chitinasiproducens palmae]SDV50679.1 Various environmental stresses-induced protein Ves [Chitinasiproducens palmae]